MVAVSEERRRFVPQGKPLALDPKALGLPFPMVTHQEPEMSDDGVVIINIHGPLMHHPSFFFDSYDAITCRMQAALSLQPRLVVLSIDSPGGLVSGAFDTARQLRELCGAAGVKLYSHIAGVGASAAYALATAGEYIGASQTAMVGSIGVLDMLVDATAQNEMLGLNVQLIASGQRKTDGNPDAQMTEGAVSATQQRVDELAEMFFDLVTEHEYGNGQDELRALQAGVFTGEEAVSLGLATEVITQDKMLALARQGATMPDKATMKGEQMTTPMEDAIESLRQAAEGDNEEEAEKARKMLSALDDEETDAEGDEEEPDAEGDEEEPDAEDDEEPEAEGDEEEPEAQDDDEDAKAGSAKSIALRALAKVHNMEARRKQEKLARVRAKLIASRPDFSDEMVALLQDKSTPIKTVRKMVATLEVGKPRRTRKSAAASTTAVGTRGNGNSVDRSARLPADDAHNLKVQMGLVKTIKAIKHEPNRMIFGASVAQKENK